MISSLGRVLGFDALNELFMLAGGKKLGFRIELSELRGLAESATGCPKGVGTCYF